MNVLFDSSVIIDAITERDFSNAGAKDLYLKAVKKEINGYLISKQITDMAYVLRKYVEKEIIRSFCQFLCKAFIVLPFTKEDIEEATKLDGSDFEDDILMYVASNNNIDYITTNNIKDFLSTTANVIRPDDLLNIIKTTNG